MPGLTNQEIKKIVNGYIGVFDGYLSNFTYRTHADFYPEYCGFDVDTESYEGTIRKRFIAIVENSNPDTQAKIVRGITKRFSLNDEDRKPATRTKELHDELLSIARRLEGREADKKAEKEVAGGEVFISYAWGGESEKCVNQLDEAFRTNGITIIRDKRNLGFKGQIKEFMEKLGRSKAVIVVISEKYLKSESCMFELVQIAKNGQFHRRVFPIVLGNANIHRAISRIGYIQYWEEQIKELDEAMKTVGSANLQGFREDIDLYTEIRATISNLINILRDMNTLTTDIHIESNFKALFDEVKYQIDGRETASGQLNQPPQEGASTETRTTYYSSSSQSEDYSERFLKLRVHKAVLIRSITECYFVNLTNLSPSRVLEVTHVWYEDGKNPSIPLIQPQRRLPVRLELDQSWETWIPTNHIPEGNRDSVYCSFYARISTGSIFRSEINSNVPTSGTVPGGSIE